MTTLPRAQARALAVVALGLSPALGCARARPPQAPAPAVSPTAVSIEDEDRRAEARRHFQDGVRLADQNRLTEALAEFKLAFATVPHYAFLRNIGLTYALLERPSEAIEYLRRYLEEGGAAVSPQSRAEIEGDIAAQTTRTALVTVRTIPRGAQIRVGERDLGVTPLPTPVRVDVGHRRFTATMAGYDAAERAIALTGDVPATVELELVRTPLAPGSPSTAAGAPAAPEDETPRGSPTGSPAAHGVEPATGTGERTGARRLGALELTAVAVGGAGVIGLGAAEILWELAKSRNDQAIDLYQRFDDRAYDAKSEAENLATCMKYTLVASGALIATGAGLFVFDRIFGRKSPTGSQGSSRVSLIPAFSGGSPGFWATGTWQ